jgi:PAS domain S-box-containing protein
MSTPSDDNWDKLRGQIIGLGEHSARKSYYPELQQRIRELEETRATLAASNRQLQAVLDAASEVAIIATDPDGLITLFNHGAEKMLGYGAPEVVGKQTTLIFHLESEVEARAEILSKELGRNITGFTAFVENARFLGLDNREWTYVRKDGATLLVNLIVTSIHDEHGAINGFLGIAEDITRQKVMEHQIVENEKLLGTIINSIPNPIFYKDRNGVYTGCNDAFCTYMGMHRQRVVGCTVFDIAPPDLAEIYHRADLELMERSGTQKYEANFVYADGAVHDVIFYKSCLLDSGGAVCGLVGVMLDITDRKRVEQELAQKEELFHLLFEKSGDANLLIDGEVFIDCNTATIRMLGYQDKQQVIFAHPSDLSPEYQPDGQLSSVKASEMIKQAYDRGSHRFEWLHKRADGTELPVEVMLTAIPMNDRTIIHTAWRDLTEQKRAEAENDRLTRNLLHSQKIESIGRLAGGVAHDFNNLLMPIMGYTEMLQEFCASDERAARRLRGIRYAAEKASDLTRQLLAFGRKQLLEMKAVDLNQTIEAFRLILERTIREDVHIELHLDPGLGAILADVSQIEQIIMNLVVNAQDAMPAGGTLVVETANCHLGMNSLSGPDLPAGAYVKLVVSDNGCGMDKETLKCIFEPFYTTKEQGKGTGLGLATVFGIVKQHGGNINVYSEIGHGSTFTIYFPRLAEVQQSEEAEVTQIELSPLEHDATILVVEDSPMVRELAVELLTGRGYGVLVAETPTQARAIMEQNGGTIDLLLSDVIMPEKNGLELYDELRRLWSPLKVLFMSGYSENIVTHQNQMAHNFNYIQKPFSSQELFAKINEILSHKAVRSVGISEL